MSVTIQAPARGRARDAAALLRYGAVGCVLAGLAGAALNLPGSAGAPATSAVCPVEDGDWQLIDLPPVECESAASPPGLEAFVPSIVYAGVGVVAGIQAAALAMTLTLFREASLYRRATTQWPGSGPARSAASGGIRRAGTPRPDRPAAPRRADAQARRRGLSAR